MLLFALPVFLGNVFQQLYNTFDAWCVGNYIGDDALAAVSSSGSLIFMMISFFNGVAMGAGVVIARLYGAKQYDAMKKAIHTAIAFGLVTGVLLTIAGVAFTPTILRWMGTPEEVLPQSISYFRYYFCGAIFTVMYNIFVGILHAVGDSKHPLYYLIIGSFTNIALDLLQEIKETKKQDNGFFRTYNQILFVPMNDFGARLLRLVTSVNWREELLRSLFEPEQYTTSWGSLQFDVLVDGIDTYCFLNGDIRNLFNFRNTILMRKEGLLRHGLVVGHKVICYPEQLTLVQEFFGDLADIATVSIDDVERVLELDSPSLIE